MFTRIQQKKRKQQCYEKFEAALKVEMTVLVITQGQPDSKRGAPDISQPGTSQSSRKKGKKWTSGRGSGRGVVSSQGSVLSLAALRGGRSLGSSFPLCPTCQRRHLGEFRMNMTGCFHCGQEHQFIQNCPQLVAAETSEVGSVASTPGTSCPSQASRGGSGRGGSATPGRARGRGIEGRGPDWSDTEWYSYSGLGIYSHTAGGRCITRRDYWYDFGL